MEHVTPIVLSIFPAIDIYNKYQDGTQLVKK
jgi:hypothetical protein